MNKRDFLIAAAAMFGLCTGGVMAEPSKNFKVFLCFGQSNMSGGAGVGPDAKSQVTNSRVHVLAFQDCGSPKRTYNQWSVASEPMHCGDGVNSMGPSFAFGTTLADSLKQDTIGLIPCGLWGVPIARFMKNGSDNTQTAGITQGSISPNAYNWMLEKCKIAVKRGVFAGIILEQGESNSGDGDSWLTKVKSIYDDLKKDIPLTGDVPLVAGQLLGSNQLNTTIAKMSTAVPLGYYASSSGLQGGGSMANLHFNQDGYRTLGQRMAVEMMKGLRASGQITSASHSSSKNAFTINNLQKTSLTSLHTINGKKIPAGSMQNLAAEKKHCIYVMQTPGKKASLVVKPE